ncbi:MAG: GAF domain-containing sensor histidine kinase, partial [Candidatus Omnitrophota bacterium]
LLKVVSKLITMGVEISHVLIYLEDIEKNVFIRKQANVRSGIKIPARATTAKSNALIRQLKNHKETIVSEELNIDKKNHSLIKSLSSLKAAVVIPLIVQKDVIGFIVLGKKLSGEMYTKQDLNVFQIMANQAALAIENAIFYEETGKTLAEQFHEHRLRSIGKMGSYMGHQVNNRFQAILIEAEKAQYLTLEKLNQENFDSLQKELISKTKEALESVQSNAKLGGDIAKRLTSFSRKETKIKDIDIKDAIASVAHLLSCKFDINELNLVRDVTDADEYKLKADNAQIQDILFNLLDNAYDAQRSKLVKNKKFVFKTHIKAYVNNRRWHIEVSDNGEGMDKEQLDQLFLPFFTTKATTEKGTGLGLSIIKAMVEHNNGTIRVESEKNKGTTFFITFPAVKNSVERTTDSKIKSY